MRPRRAAVALIALGVTFTSHRALAQSQAGSTPLAPCEHSPVSVGAIDDTIYASLRSIGRDTLPQWYAQVLLEGLVEHFSPPSPLDIPVVGGPLHAPVRSAQAIEGAVLTALRTTPGAGSPRPRHEPPSTDQENQPRSVQPESVTVAILGEVAFTIHRDGTLGNARVFTSSLSPTFDASLLHSVSAADSVRALPPLPGTMRGDSIVLLLTARDHRDSAGMQAPLFHATVPIWIAERPVRARPRNPAPLYPQNAERAHIGDEVRYSFVVDQMGTPRMETLRLLHGKYREFQRAVLAVLPHWAFDPATIAGCAVMQCVQLPFAFNMGY